MKFTQGSVPSVRNVIQMYGGTLDYATFMAVPRHLDSVQNQLFVNDIR